MSKSGGNNMAFVIPTFAFNFNVNQIFAVLSGINANFCFVF